MPRARTSLAPAVLLLAFGIAGAGCAFNKQVIDRSNFAAAEMMIETDEILFDRDLPDITWTIVSTWGLGAGGGSVGGCWSCGCRKTGLIGFPLKAGLPPMEETPEEPSAVEPPGGAGGSNPGDGQPQTIPGEAIWKPPVEEEPEPFEEKGEKDVTFGEKKRQDILLEYRASNVFKEPTAPNLGRLPDQLYYLNYNIGLTSNSSFQVEAQQFAFENTANTNWARLDWARLFTTGARLDLELGGLQFGDNSGFRTAVTYGWAPGLNLDLTTRFQTSSVQGLWGYQIEAEGVAAITPTSAVWGNGYFYWDQSNLHSQASRFSLGLAQYLGHRTGLHASAYLANARSVDISGVSEASSASARLELRHRLAGRNTLLRAAYLQYFDSWSINAGSFSFRVAQPFKHGSLSAGYRYYQSSEGLEAGTWLAAVGYKW